MFSHLPLIAHWHLREVLHKRSTYETEWRNASPRAKTNAMQLHALSRRASQQSGWRHCGFDRRPSPGRMQTPDRRSL